MLKDTQLFKRLTSESPSFFKRITTIGATLGAVGLAIIAAPATMGISVPAALLAVAGKMALAGTVAAAISKTTVKDSSDLK